MEQPRCGSFSRRVSSSRTSIGAPIVSILHSWNVGCSRVVSGRVVWNRDPGEFVRVLNGRESSTHSSLPVEENLDPRRRLLHCACTRSLRFLAALLRRTGPKSSLTAAVTRIVTSPAKWKLRIGHDRVRAPRDSTSAPASAFGVPFPLLYAVSSPRGARRSSTSWSWQRELFNCLRLERRDRQPSSSPSSCSGSASAASPAASSPSAWGPAADRLRPGQVGIGLFVCYSLRLFAFIGSFTPAGRSPAPGWPASTHAPRPHHAVGATLPLLVAHWVRGGQTSAARSEPSTSSHPRLASARSPRRDPLPRPRMSGNRRPRAALNLISLHAVGRLAARAGR